MGGEQREIFFFFKEKTFIIEAAGAAKTVMCVCVCVFGYVGFKWIGVFPACVQVCLCLCLVCELLAPQTKPRFDQSVIGVKTQKGDPFSCPATSAALWVPLPPSIHLFVRHRRLKVSTNTPAPLLWHDLSPSVPIGVNVWQNVWCPCCKGTRTHICISMPHAHTWWAKTSACCRRPSSSCSFSDISVNSSVTSLETVQAQRQKINKYKSNTLSAIYNGINHVGPKKLNADIYDDYLFLMYNIKH